MPRTIRRSRTLTRGGTMVAALAALALVTSGCGGGSGASGGSSKTSGVTITVALASDAPPKAVLDEFTKETGIKVKWVNIDWDSLQTKISAAATAKTYFADATDVDWSRVGQLGKLGWFYPMDSYLDTKAMAADVPQLASFTSDGHVVGIPYDASFMVTTVNTEMFTKAGVNACPQTMDDYTAALQEIKDKGVVEVPAEHPVRGRGGAVHLLVRSDRRLRWDRARQGRQAAVQLSRARPATRLRSGWSTRSRTGSCHRATSTSPTRRVSRP